MPVLKLVDAEPPQSAPIVILDAGPLGIISNPKATPENNHGKALLRAWLSCGARVVVPHVADYEVRRERRRLNNRTGLARLDAMRAGLLFWPITPNAMERAASLWAQARQQGKPAASNLALDADMMLLAQAEEIRAVAVVATGNVRHLAPFFNAQQWQDVT